MIDSSWFLAFLYLGLLLLNAFPFAFSLYHTWCYFGGLTCKLLYMCGFLRLMPMIGQMFMLIVQSEIHTEKNVNDVKYLFSPYGIGSGRSLDKNVWVFVALSLFTILTLTTTSPRSHFFFFFFFFYTSPVCTSVDEPLWMYSTTQWVLHAVDARIKDYVSKPHI